MKKLILYFLIALGLLQASELLTYKTSNKTHSFCTDNHYFKNNKLFFKKSSSNYISSIKLNNVKSFEFEAGYIYENDKCMFNNKSISEYNVDDKKPIYSNLSILGLSQNDFSYLMALSGIICSSFFLYGLFRWM